MLEETFRSLVIEHGNVQLGFDSGANLGVTHYNKRDNTFMTFQLNSNEMRQLRDWLNGQFAHEEELLTETVAI